MTNLRSLSVKRRVALGITCAITAMAGVAVHVAGASADPAPGGLIAQKIAEPAYIHPTADPQAWDRLIASSPASLGIVVANVTNGPDAQPVAAWSAVIQRAHAAGIKVLGYVDSGYLGTTGLPTRLGSSAMEDWISQMERDINAWYAFYGPNIDGIFFDEGQNQCGPAAGSNDWADMYRTMSSYVKDAHPGAVTVINPGTAVPQCYENAADILVTFEGSYAAYSAAPGTPTGTYVPLTWDPVDPQKIWHLIYGAGSQAAMDDAISLSKQRNAGYVYVTDDTPGNPWDTLPAQAYWSDEEGRVAPSGWPGSSAPPAPGNVAVGNVSGSSVELSWATSTVTAPAASAPVTAYDIYENGTRISSVSAARSAFQASGLTPSTSYGLSVRARDAAGGQSDASVVTATTGPAAANPPGVPRGVSADGTDYTSTTLTWSPARPGDAAVAGYAIEQDGVRIMRVPDSVTSLTVGGLVPGGQTATFTVTALDASGGESGPSAPVSATTLSLPGGQGIDSAEASQDGTNLTYQANFYEPFAYHRVYIATSTATAAPCLPTPTTPTVCATLLIENSQLYSYAGTGTDWKWAPVSPLTPQVDGYTYTWTIPPSTIGSADTETAVFQGDGYAPTATSPVVTPTQQPTEPPHHHRSYPHRRRWHH